MKFLFLLILMLSTPTFARVPHSWEYPNTTCYAEVQKTDDAIAYMQIGLDKGQLESMIFAQYQVPYMTDQYTRYLIAYTKQEANLIVSGKHQQSYIEKWAYNKCMSRPVMAMSAPPPDPVPPKIIYFSKVTCEDIYNGAVNRYNYILDQESGESPKSAEDYPLFLPKGAYPSTHAVSATLWVYSPEDIIGTVLPESIWAQEETWGINHLDPRTQEYVDPSSLSKLKERVYYAFRLILFGGTYQGKTYSGTCPKLIQEIEENYQIEAEYEIWDATPEPADQQFTFDPKSKKAWAYLQFNH